jgi:hypothetical protein
MNPATCNDLMIEAKPCSNAFVRIRVGRDSVSALIVEQSGRGVRRLPRQGTRRIAEGVR